MKSKYRFTAVLLLTIAVCAYFLTSFYIKNQVKEEDGNLNVITSFYPMYIATANVVGDCEGITVRNLSEPQTGCLHDFQLTPGDMKLLSTADIFVINGGGMESFLSDVMKQYPNLTIVEAIDGIELSEEDNYTDTHAHAHSEEENAHVWMSVKKYRSQVENIANALCEAAKTNTKELKANAKAYDGKLAELEAQQEEILGVAAGNQIISFHDAYEYLAEDYSLEVSYILNLDEERQVSAGEVADVLEVVNEDGVHVIFAEEMYGRDLADTVSKEADVKVYYLDTLTRGDCELDSYINGMQENINILKEAFGVN